VGLLADCGCFEQNNFWTSWVDKWLEDNGVRNDGNPPESIMLLFRLLDRLISATPDLVTKGNLTKFKPWAFRQLEQFHALYDAGLNIMVANGPRTLLATGFLSVLAAYCKNEKVLTGYIMTRITV
jgi:hypothetical protein